MTIHQLSVFVENKIGRLAEITEVIGSAGVDIRALSVADTTDFGILRVIVNRPKAAYEALKAAGMAVSLTEVIAISIADQPGAFAKEMRLLAENGIGVEYMYAFITREEGNAYVILRVSDNARAINVIRQNGFTVLPPDKVYDL